MSPWRGGLRPPESAAARRLTCTHRRAARRNGRS